MGDEVRILLQARVADGDKSGHRRGEKTDLEGWGLVVSIRLSSRLGQRGTYKNEDGICTFFPVLHIFLVELLGTGSIHIEDSSGRVTVIGPARSHGDAVTVAQSLNVKHVTPPRFGPIGLVLVLAFTSCFLFLFHHPLLLPESRSWSLFNCFHPRHSLIVVKQIRSTTKPTSLPFTQQPPPFCLFKHRSYHHPRSTQYRLLVRWIGSCRALCLGHRRASVSLSLL